MTYGAYIILDRIKAMTSDERKLAKSSLISLEIDPGKYFMILIEI